MYLIRYNYVGGISNAINPDNSSWATLRYRNRLNNLQSELQAQFIMPPQPLGLTSGELADWNYIMGVAKNQYYLSVHNVLVGLRLLSNVFDEFFPKPAKVSNGQLEAFDQPLGYNTDVVPESIVQLYENFLQILTDNPTIAQIRAFLSNINITQYVQSIQNFFNSQAAEWNNLTPSWNDKYLSHVIGINPFARQDNFNNPASQVVMADNEYPGHRLWNFDPAAANYFLNESEPSTLTWYWNTIWVGNMQANDYQFLLRYATGGGKRAAADAASLAQTFNPTQSAIYRYTAYMNLLTSDSGGEQALNAILQAKQNEMQRAAIAQQQAQAAAAAQQAANEIAAAKAAQQAAAEQQAAANAATALAQETINKLKTGESSMLTNRINPGGPMQGIHSEPVQILRGNPALKTALQHTTPAPQTVGMNVPANVRAGISPITAGAAKNSVMTANPAVTQGVATTPLQTPAAQSPTLPAGAQASGHNSIAGLKVQAAAVPSTNSTSTPAQKTETHKTLGAIGMVGIALGLLFLL